ncbi:MAG: malonic semialdehyde reductase [Rhodospirillaceae bacterium]|nr:malonic semialdehyde reductase [Rhodospirillaceae bacterium]|tara:strand:+ start:707 stop:1321 length:615 start_codon:yes stop_codon:yes gene_type:complete
MINKLTDTPKLGVDRKALDLLFLQARTHSVWQDKPVKEATLRELFDLMKMAPTSMNISPIRIIFACSFAAKERLRPTLVAGNIEKTMTAPVCAIIGYDRSCWKHLERLFPRKDMTKMYRDNPIFADTTAFRNSSLQGAYFIMAARSLGLDCGPMSGFDNSAVDQEFFCDTDIKSNFLCNLGYGVRDKIPDRAPRFEFDDICKIA